MSTTQPSRIPLSMPLLSSVPRPEPHVSYMSTTQNPLPTRASPKRLQITDLGGGCSFHAQQLRRADVRDLRMSTRVEVIEAIPRPSCRHDLIAFSGDMVDLKHQFRSCGRQPCRTSARNCPLGCPDSHLAPLHRHIGARIIALILGHAEAQHPRVEVNGSIQVRRKDLKPQRHLHERIVTYPSSIRTCRAPHMQYRCRGDQRSRWSSSTVRPASVRMLRSVPLARSRPG